ncbi:hypothetical protein RN001_005770 [Aquatica leii]|uniref:Uncharacterized protein n=1 Tax=Aquatica leii TaxID=1421715 RepID=A0AAN7SAS8_9COLE|nr:hypothetical protein RN001_005770 [Aquatica leii]
MALNMIINAALIDEIEDLEELIYPGAVPSLQLYNHTDSTRRSPTKRKLEDSPEIEPMNMSCENTELQDGIMESQNKKLGYKMKNMNNPDFILLINVIENDEEMNQHRLHRQQLRDTSNPLSLPETAFRGIYRLSRELALDIINNLSPFLPNQQRKMYKVLEFGTGEVDVVPSSWIKDNKVTWAKTAKAFALKNFNPKSSWQLYKCKTRYNDSVFDSYQEASKNLIYCFMKLTHLTATMQIFKNCHKYGEFSEKFIIQSKREWEVIKFAIGNNGNNKLEQLFQELLPLSSVDNIKVLNELLMENDKRAYFITRAKRIGGKDAKATIANIIKNYFTVETQHT